MWGCLFYFEMTETITDGRIEVRNVEGRLKEVTNVAQVTNVANVTL